MEHLESARVRRRTRVRMHADEARGPRVVRRPRPAGERAGGVLGARVEHGDARGLQRRADGERVGERDVRLADTARDGAGIGATVAGVDADERRRHVAPPRRLSSYAIAPLVIPSAIRMPPAYSAYPASSTTAMIVSRSAAR